MNDADIGQGFNLLHERWIPVVLTDGVAREVSILNALKDASEIRELSGDIPQEVLPIMRMLLAILYRSHGYETNSESELIEMWTDIWNQGHFDYDLIEEYLLPLERRFDLFDSNHPFFQVAGLDYDGKGPDPVGELIADVPKPDKYLFSTRDRNHLDGISYAEAARWLIFMHAYDTAGIKSPVVGNTHKKSGKVYAPKGAVGTGLLGAEGGVYFEGINLFQTLMLNWVLFDSQRSQGAPLLGNVHDSAAWERESGDPDSRLASPDEPAGPVGMFTWQSRRIRLARDIDAKRVTGVVSCYGDITAIVDKQGVEPMTAWRESKQQQKKLGTPYVPLMPVVHDSSRLLWRGTSSLIAARRGDNETDLRPGIVRWVDTLYEENAFGNSTPVVTIHAQGMEYGTQSSVFSNGIDDSFSFPVSMLRYDSEECLKTIEVIGQTEDAVDGLARFVYNVNKASGSKAKGNATQDGVCERAYNALDDIFKERLAHFTPDVDAIKYCDAWRDQVHRKLLMMAEDHVSSSARSYFSEHYGMSVGKAFSRYRASLNRVLGRLVTQTDDKSLGHIRDEKKGE